MGRTFHNLQALRGAACLTVIWFHVTDWERQYGVRTPLFEQVRWVGTGCVDVFFALSGFLIPYSQAGRMGRPAAGPVFLLRRLWRIFPTYWAILAASALALLVLMGQPLFAHSWDQSWAYWVVLLPSGPPNMYVGPAWTLSYELAFYLVFAGVIMLRPRVGAAVMVAWGVAVVVALADPPRNPYARAFVSPFILELLGGYIAAVLVMNGRTGRGWTAVVLGVLYMVAAVVAARLHFGREWIPAVGGDHRLWVAVYGLPAVLLVYGLAAIEIHGRVFAPHWLRHTGDASYSLYLAHGPVYPFAISYGCLIPHSRLPHLGWIAATLTACLALGFLFHYAVERPFMRMGKKKPKPATEPAAEPARLAA